jgi:hypothetical protein
MNKHEIYESFRSEVSNADTQEIRCLHDLCHDGTFAREAGVEFVLAVEEAADRKGINERPGRG